MEDQAMSNRLFSKNFLWIVTLAGLFMQSWLPGLNLSPQAAQAAEPVAASTTLLEASSKWKLESLVVNGQEGWGLFSDSTPAVGPDGEVVFNAIRTEGSGIYSLAAAPFIPVALDRQLLPNGMGILDKPALGSVLAQGDVLFRGNRILDTRSEAGHAFRWDSQNLTITQQVPYEGVVTTHFVQQPASNGRWMVRHDLADIYETTTIPQKFVLTDGQAGQLILEFTQTNDVETCVKRYIQAVAPNANDVVAYIEVTDTGTLFPGDDPDDPGPPTCSYAYNHSTIEWTIKLAGALQASLANGILTHNGVHFSGTELESFSTLMINDRNEVAFVQKVHNGSGGVNSQLMRVDASGQARIFLESANSPWERLNLFGFDHLGRAAVYTILDDQVHRAIISVSESDTDVLAQTGGQLFGQTVTFLGIPGINAPSSLQDDYKMAFVYGLANNTVGIASATYRPKQLWTILHYMAADNDLAATYPPIFNHLESMANLPETRILALWDGPTNGDTAYYDIQFDTNPNVFASYQLNVNYFQQGELNTGHSKTLSDFIIWGMEFAPAEYYVLILDDHGSGLDGLAYDDTGTKDHLTLPEWRAAMQTAFNQTGRKVDVLYMAMCLMGMIEDAYQVREFADYYIASQDLQTAYVPYLSGFDPADEPAAAAIQLAKSYENSMVTGNHEYTISVADMSKLQPLVNATNELGAALEARTEVISATVSNVATVVQRFDDNPSGGGLTLADSAIDLFNFAELIGLAAPAGEVEIVAKAESVRLAVQDYVIYEKHASGGGKSFASANGVSIFLPGTASSFYNDSNYDFAVGATWGLPGMARPRSSQTAATWGSFLVSYFAATQPGGPDNPNPPPLRTKEQPSPLFRTYLPLTMRP